MNLRIAKQKVLQLLSALTHWRQSRTSAKHADHLIDATQTQTRIIRYLSQGTVLARARAAVLVLGYRRHTNDLIDRLGVLEPTNPLRRDAEVQLEQLGLGFVVAAVRRFEIEVLAKIRHQVPQITNPTVESIRRGVFFRMRGLDFDVTYEPNNPYLTDGLRFHVKKPTLQSGALNRNQKT